MTKSRFRRLKNTIIASLSIILLIGLGMLGYRHIVPTVSFSHALIQEIDSLERLEELSELIVQVSVAGKGRNYIHTHEESGGKDYLTFTPVRIEKVHKGDAHPGDIIEIIEPFGYERLPWGLYSFGSEGYVPLQQSSSYLLFIRKSNDGAYTTCGVWQGRYVWPIPKTLTAETLEVTDFSGHYQILYEAVAAKYGQEN